MEVKNNLLFFFSGKVEVKDGYLVYKSGIWDILFGSISRIKLSDITGIFPKDNKLGGASVVITDKIIKRGNPTSVIKLSDTEVPKLFQMIHENAPDLEIFNQQAKVVTPDKTYSVAEVLRDAQTLRFDNGAAWISESRIDILDKKDESSTLLAEDFEQLEFFAISKKSLYTGGRKYQIQAEIPHSLSEKIKSHLIASGAKNLAKLKEGESFESKWSLKKWVGWNPKETITIGSDFIGFEMKKKKGSDNIILPIADIFVDMSKKKMFSSKIEIRGIQNIIPKGKFQREVVDKLREKIQAPVADTSSKCHKRFLRVFRLWAKKKGGSNALVKNKNQLILNLSKKDSERFKSKDRELKTVICNFDDIKSFASKKCGLFGPRDVIFYTLSSNMRYDKGQESMGIYIHFNRMSDFAPIAEYLQSKGVAEVSWKKLFNKK